MRGPAEREDFISVLPIDPIGADDPAMIEAFPEHARLIGQIIVEWSHVEFKILSVLALGLGVPTQAVRSMTYAIDSSGARLELVRAAVPHMFADDETRAECAAIVADAQSMLVQRNKFAHSLFGESSSGGFAILGVRRETAADLPLHDLTHQFERMKALSFRVGRLIARRVGLYSEQPSEQHASEILQTLARNLSGARIHPPRPEQP